MRGWAGKMASWVKVFAMVTEDPRSLLERHVEDGENDCRTLSS